MGYTDRLTELRNFVNHEYDLIASDDISHGRALFEIAREAERLNSGDVRQTIRDMTRVMIGDDVTRPTSGGEFWVRPNGRIQGSEGFKPELQDESAQILHVVSGLYMTSEYTSLGTAIAISREAYTNTLRGDFESADYLVYLATDKIVNGATTNPLEDIFIDWGVVAPAQPLSSLIEYHILDLRSETEILRDEVEARRSHDARVTRNNVELASVEREWGHEPGSMGRQDYGRVDAGMRGPYGMGYDPLDPRGPWQMPGLSHAGDVAADRDKNYGRRSSDHHNDPDIQHGLITTKPAAGVVIHSGSGQKKVITWTGTKETITAKGQQGRVDHAGRTQDDPNFTGVRPLLLDLDGDGIEITELDRSTVFMDSDGTGLKNRTAWAGAGDGVLFYDADNDGLISDDREYVFTEWDPTAADDLAALRSRFDTNGDGKLSGAELNSFKVMVTNADGSRTVQTAAALGITEIRLTADTTQIAFEDGSAINGQATFVQSGTTKVLGNVTLATEANAYRVVESVTTSGGNRTVTQTGYDSAGDVVFVTTSTTNAAGTSITNRYDDNGDGVVDRFQTIVVTTGGAGQKIETETNYLGTSAAGVLSSREVVTTSADGKTVTIERDPTGGGWFSARELRVTNADGSRTGVKPDIKVSRIREML